MRSTSLRYLAQHPTSTHSQKHHVSLHAAIIIVPVTCGPRHVTGLLVAFHLRHGSLAGRVASIRLVNVGQIRR